MILRSEDVQICKCSSATTACGRPAVWEAPSLPQLVSVAQVSEDYMNQERRNHFCVWISTDCEINNGLLHQAVAKGHKFVLMLGVSS